MKSNILPIYLNKKPKSVNKATFQTTKNENITLEKVYYNLKIGKESSFGERLIDNYFFKSKEDVEKFNRQHNKIFYKELYDENYDENWFIIFEYSFEISASDLDIDKVIIQIV